MVFQPRSFSAKLLSMSSQQRIHDLCKKVSSFPEGSEEFWQALVELRDTLVEHTALLRKKIAGERTKKKSKTK